MAALPDKDQGKLPYPYGETTNDEDMRAQILNALYWHSGVPHERVKVEVRRGHVVLSGMVAKDYERSLCEHSVVETPGVVEVTNLIVVES